MLPIIQIIKKALQPLQGVRSSKNIITYFICIIISFIAWLLSTLNKDYSTEVTYPIKYIHLPEDKYAVSELPKYLQMNIQAKGFVLLGYKLKTSFLPITLNFATYSKQLENKNDLFEYTLYTNQLKDKITAQINPNIKLLSIYPESIDFKFAKAKQKKVAIQPHLNYTLKPQYILTKIQTTPDSIWISGPEVTIDTLQYIATEQSTLKKLNKDITLQLDLVNYPNLHFNETTAKVTLTVEQFTEAQHTCPIMVLNQPDSMNIQLFPAQVNINYNIGLSKYEQTKPQDFIFAIEYPLDPNATFLEIKVIKAPPFIQGLTFSPKKVEYLLEKK